MKDAGFAIVGMECIFPGAGNLANYWQNLCGGVDAITQVPEHRWDRSFYDPQSTDSDRLRCCRGGFIDEFATFDPIAYGIMPVAAKAAEPDQLLTLMVATRALRDAGYDRKPLPRQRTGIVIGRGNYPGPGRIRLEQHVRVSQQLVQALRDLLPGIDEEELARIKREFQTKIGAAKAETVIGLVPNLTASLLANRLDLNGPAYTVDAACASALVALERACQDLRCGAADVMLCGGVHTCHAEAFWSVFSELGALSTNQSIRPFDQRADGLLIGEGVGIVVLKRAEDARADGDRIYALIRGIGTSSDGRAASLMSPAVAGQVLALDRAWQATDLDPSDIELLEAHGTATPAGDAAELQTLKAFFGAKTRSPRAGIGSVKSMIGHAMPAAGAAGLIKTALAIYHGVRPRTLHCEQPHALLEETSFYPLHDTQEWDTGHRIAGVNAFGFGGINAHVVLESSTPARPRPGRARGRVLPRPLLMAAESREQLLEGLASGRGSRVGRHRLAVIDPTPARLSRARRLVERGRRVDGRQGFFYAFDELADQKERIVFLFPGLDAHFAPRLDDVAEHFGLKQPRLDDESSLEARGVAIMEVNGVLERALAELGIKPDAAAGHSIGEWSAMVATGVIEQSAMASFLATLSAGSLEIADTVFAVAACGLEQANELLADLPEMEISHDNCAHQVVFCGSERAMGSLLDRARSAAVLCQRLPFGSGVHSSFFTAHLTPHIANVRTFRFQTARIPLYSATSCEPYPADAEAITALAIEHMIRRVRFRELTQRLHADGCRLFIQVGTGSLASFVEDTLRGQPHAAISANVAQRSGLEQLLRVACLVWARGGEPHFEALCGDDDSVSNSSIRLSLGVPLVRFDRPLQDLRVGAAVVPDAVDQTLSARIETAFANSVRSVSAAQSEVMSAYARRSNPGEQTRFGRGPSESSPTRIKRRIGLDTLPELRDHAFFRQPHNWPEVSDTGPVVPMTAIIELMLSAARELLPGKTITAVEDIEAVRWLSVAEPVELELDIVRDGDSKLLIHVGDYAQGTVVFGEIETPPACEIGLQHERPASIDARALYEEGWMFHGKAYQGIARLGPMARDGIRGELLAGAASGALLDNAGQLLGYWVMVNTDTDRLAMPVKIRRLRLFQSHPQPDERVECQVRIRSLGALWVEADMTLVTRSGTWAQIEGWQDRRFVTDEALWGVIRQPDRNLLSSTPAIGVAIFDDRYDSAPSREYMAGRYLGRPERQVYGRMAPRDRRAWLRERIAVKDAARNFLWACGAQALFPVEVELDEDRVCVRNGEHEHWMAVATASASGCCTAVIGATRAVVGMFPLERAAVPHAPNAVELMLGAGDDADEWVARLAAAKWVTEAITGETSPLGAVLVEDRRGERLLTPVGWVDTLRHGEHMIGWVAK